MFTVDSEIMHVPDTDQCRSAGWGYSIVGFANLSMDLQCALLAAVEVFQMQHMSV